MGRAPRGSKTDWVMNEYRLPDSSSSSLPPPQEDIVLCKIYRKATSLKELEQRAAIEEDARASIGASVSSSDLDYSFQKSSGFDGRDGSDRVEEMKKEVEISSSSSTSSPAEVVAAVAVRSVELPEIQVPRYGMEWMQDPFLTQLRSPWLDQWSPLANLLNF